MSAFAHYEHHLSNIYGWMGGDFFEKQQEQQRILKDLSVNDGAGKFPIDLGCGHGLQSISLARL